MSKLQKPGFSIFPGQGGGLGFSLSALRGFGGPGWVINASVDFPNGVFRHVRDSIRKFADGV